MLLTQLYVRVVVLLICGKHFYDHIISGKEEVWAHRIRKRRFGTI